jgi:predicted ATPase
MRDIPLHSVGPDGLRPMNVVPLWDRISLSSLEAEVINALRIISPEVERVAVKGPGDRLRRDPQGPEVDDRVPFVKVEGFEDPMPMRALGDGVNRLFGLSLALVSAKGGLLLVDEIEDGIHYSVQADLWRLIFESAARLNVQVFATTHSYDCIKAFEEAARESEEEGVLVRLARKGDRTLVGQFDERELEVAIEGDIEVR